MSPVLRLLVLALFALGFQAGIFSSAASAHKAPRCIETIVTIADAGDAEPIAADTPMPSCKSMTPAEESILAGPMRSSVSSGHFGRDRAALSAMPAGIDEPPKDVRASA